MIRVYIALVTDPVAPQICIVNT